jgi:hypothetical protein
MSLFVHTFVPHYPEVIRFKITGRRMLKFRIILCDYTIRFQYNLVSVDHVSPGLLNVGKSHRY